MVRDYPIAGHDLAPKAAEAVHCAAEEGVDQRWKLHRHLYRNYNALELENLSRYAEQVGLDVDAFEKCLDENRYAEEVQKDLLDASRFGVEGTPSFFVGRTDPETKIFTAVENLHGAHPFQSFKDSIEKLLAE